jgi:hypothetical protein
MAETEATCDQAFTRFREDFRRWRPKIPEANIKLKKPKPQDPNDPGDGAGGNGPASDPNQTEWVNQKTNTTAAD